jgi:DNA-binding response OmpR family regulator
VHGHQHGALLVEDDPDSREVLRVALEASGFAATVAETAGDGLALLRGGLRCCLVILDWRLPDMNGAAFLRTMRADAALTGIPVAVCTGDSGVRAEALGLGAGDVLVKPIDPTDLVKLVGARCPAHPGALP